MSGAKKRELLEKYQKKIDKLQEQLNGSSKANITSKGTKKWQLRANKRLGVKSCQMKSSLACVSFKKMLWVQELTERPPQSILEKVISQYWKWSWKDGIPLVRREESLVAIPHEQIQIHSFTYPKQDLLFSKEKADVCLESQALLYLKVKENTIISGSSNGAKVYLNGQILEEVDASIQVGDVWWWTAFFSHFENIRSISCPWADSTLSNLIICLKNLIKLSSHMSF